MADNDLVPTITAAVRIADERFQKSGGSSRHWVIECLLPALEEHGLVIVGARLAADMVSAAKVKELAEYLEKLAPCLSDDGLTAGMLSAAALARELLPKPEEKTE